MTTLTTKLSADVGLWGLLTSIFETSGRGSAPRTMPANTGRTTRLNDAMLRDIGLGEHFGRPGADYYDIRF